VKKSGSRLQNDVGLSPKSHVTIPGNDFHITGERI